MTAFRGFSLALLLTPALWLAGVPAISAAKEPDPQLARLAAALSALDNDPELAGKAALERFKAGQALDNAQLARSRDRDHALLLANAWVEAAQDAARAELLNQQAAELDRERDQIMFEASRRDAELARREADRLRLQSLAREEEAQRTAESMEQERIAAEQSAAQASDARASQTLKLADARANEAKLARKEAELAAAVAADSSTVEASPPPSLKSGNRTIYTLPGTAFASGSATLTASAQVSLRRIPVASGKRSVRIEAHTDSQGSDAANIVLSQQRADAVREVLLAAGFAPGRVKAIGKGEADQLADNGSAEGRALNRRVEIIVE